MIPLSVIDLSPVSANSTAAVALHNSLDLARLADQLNYTRFWVAEHHNTRSIASSAPEIMISEIASQTRKLRVGAGGVILPNHPPLMVAERFKVLEALHPGRIDLGIGRAPGPDPVELLLLRRRQDVRNEDDFLQRLQELLHLEAGDYPSTHQFYSVKAMPIGVPLPPIWLLGSGRHSSKLAAAIGVGFAFAHHFSDEDPVEPMRNYRASFKASHWRERPHAILAVSVVCADSNAEAERAASTIDLSFVRGLKDEHLPLASPDEASTYSYTSSELESIKINRARVFVGNRSTVIRRLAPLIESSQADELMISTMVYDHSVRRRSYQLMADLGL
jgi:luciferase family oxidoreductase group 1